MIVKNTKKGFTLIEILIATAIFAIVMVMTTSIIGQSVGYQAKIQAVRQTSQESRKLADMLSRDIRSAKTPFKIAYGSGSSKVANYKNGIGIFNCKNSVCTIQETTSEANTLVINDGINLKIYWFVTATAEAVYYYEYKIDKLDPTTGLITQPDGTTKNLYQILTKTEENLIAGSVGSPDTNLDIKTTVILKSFYCLDDSDATNITGVSTQQTFIEFEIKSEVGLASGKPTDHAISSIQTMVTTRSYGL